MVSIMKSNMPYEEKVKLLLKAVEDGKITTVMFGKLITIADQYRR